MGYGTEESLEENHSRQLSPVEVKTLKYFDLDMDEWREVGFYEQQEMITVYRLVTNKHSASGED